MKKFDLWAVILFPLLIFFLVFFFGLKINYLESLILIFVLPAVYLSLRNKNKIRKVAWFTFLVSIPVAFIVELVVFGDNGWTVPHSVFPFRFFGFIPLEDYLWMFLVTYIILMFYEHFCNAKFQPKIGGKIKIMNYLLYSLLGLVMLVFILDSSFLRIPYAYLWLGLIFFLIPVILFLKKYTSYISKFFKVQVFFFYIHLIFELIGLKLSHWIYPGAHYLGWISFLNLRFPVEEFFFVMILRGFAACSYYEFFANKK